MAGLEPEALGISGEFHKHNCQSPQVTRRDQVNRYMLDAVLDTMLLKCEKQQQVTHGSYEIPRNSKSMVQTEGCRSAGKGQVCPMPTGRPASPTPGSGLVAGRGFLLWSEGNIWDTPTHSIMGSILAPLAEDPTSASTPNVSVTACVSGCITLAILVPQ